MFFKLVKHIYHEASASGDWVITPPPPLPTSCLFDIKQIILSYLILLGNPAGLECIAELPKALNGAS